MNFLTKVRTLTLGAAHDVVDATVNLNSPSAVRQSVRDIEAALDKLKTESAVQEGSLRTMQREKGDLETSIAHDKATITKLLASTDPNASSLAKNKGVLVIQNQKHLDDLTASIQNQQQIADTMRKAVDDLDSKHALMVSRVRELERLDRDSKTKEQAASAISNAGKLVGDINDPSVDDLEDRMHRRNDVASAKFDQAVGSMHTEDSVDTSDVDALLASLQPTVK